MILTAEREIAVMKVCWTFYCQPLPPLESITVSTYPILLPLALPQLLDHPNIMHLYDVWSSEAELYLVLEYIEGGELFDYLCSKGERLHLLEAVSIIKQVCGMMIAH